METIEVVIKIPKEEYYYIQLYGSIKPFSGNFIAKQIKNGAVLPQGHGRLKDIDQIINDGIDKGFCDWYDEMEMADTIVKEDNEVENNGV